MEGVENKLEIQIPQEQQEGGEERKEGKEGEERGEEEIKKKKTKKNKNRIEEEENDDDDDENEENEEENNILNNTYSTININSSKSFRAAIRKGESYSEEGELKSPYADFILMLKRKELSSCDINNNVEYSILDKIHVIKASNIYKLSWDLIVVLSIIWTILYVPYQLSFNIIQTFWLKVLTILIDLIFSIDTILSFFTSYYDGSEEITSFRKISKRYLTTWFIPDVVSIFPFEYFVANDSYVSFGLVKIFRLFRLIKIIRIARLQHKLSIANNAGQIRRHAVSLITMLFTIFFISHIYACGYNHLATCPHNAYHNFNISTPTHPSLTLLERLECEHDDNNFSLYLVSLYWTFATLLTIGYGDVTFSTESGRLYSLIVMFTGNILFGYMIAVMLEQTTDSNPITVQNQNSITKIIKYLQKKHITTTTSKRLWRHYEYYYTRYSLLNETNEILKSCPILIRKELFLISNSEIFEITMLNSNINIIFELIPFFHPYMMDSNEILLSEDEYSSEMYFVLNGNINGYKQNIITSHKKIYVGIWLSSSYFNALCCMNFQKFSPVTYKSNKISELVWINRCDIINKSKYIQKLFKIKAKEEFQQHESISSLFKSKSIFKLGIVDHHFPQMIFNNTLIDTNEKPILQYLPIHKLLSPRFQGISHRNSFINLNIHHFSSHNDNSNEKSNEKSNENNNNNNKEKEHNKDKEHGKTTKTTDDLQDSSIGNNNKNKNNHNYNNNNQLPSPLIPQVSSLAESYSSSSITGNSNSSSSSIFSSLTTVKYYRVTKPTGRIIDGLPEYTLVQETSWMMLKRGIINPQSPVKVYYDFFVLLCTILLLITIPLRFGFQIHKSTLTKYYDIVIQYIFMFDFIVSLFTAYERPDLTLNTERRDILKHYLKSWFIADFLSAFPFNLLLSQNGLFLLKLFKLFRILRITRLLKVLKISRLVKVLKLSSNKTSITDTAFSDLEEITLRFIRGVLLISFILHILACGWYYITLLSNNLNTWYNPDELISIDVVDNNIESLYIASLYYVSATSFTTGYGDIIPTNDSERIFSIVVMIIGTLVVSFVVSQVVHTESTNLAAFQNIEDLSRNSIDKIRQYLVEQCVSQSLTHSVLKHCYHVIDVKTEYSENEILTRMPFKYRIEILLHNYNKIINQFPSIFPHSQPSISTILLRYFEPSFCSEQHYLYSYETGSSGYYLLHRGIFEIIDEDITGNELIIGKIYAGKIFGGDFKSELQFLGIRALNDCHLYCLSLENIALLQLQHPLIANDVISHLELQGKQTIENSLIDYKLMKNKINSQRFLSLHRKRSTWESFWNWFLLEPDLPNSSHSYRYLDMSHETMKTYNDKEIEDLLNALKKKSPSLILSVNGRAKFMELKKRKHLAKLNDKNLDRSSHSRIYHKSSNNNSFRDNNLINDNNNNNNNNNSNINININKERSKSIHFKNKKIIPEIDEEDSHNYDHSDVLPIQNSLPENEQIVQNILFEQKEEQEKLLQNQNNSHKNENESENKEDNSLQNQENQENEDNQDNQNNNSNKDDNSNTQSKKEFFHLESIAESS